MDLKQATTVHQQWKMRLLEFLAGESEEKLDPSAVCRDNLCELGRWIHGEGRTEFGGHPVFRSLLESHAKFHSCAGAAVRKALSGDLVSAKAIVDGPFHEQTIQTVMAINRLRRVSESKVA